MSNVTEKPQSAVQKTKAIFENEDVKKRLQEMLGKRSAGFITSVLSAVNASDKLMAADANTIYMSAMMAASLDLPINSNLGLAYIIPYNMKQGDNTWKTVAQFQVGYKGFIQLALRSGQFQTISAAPVYDGQLKSQDPLKGYEFDWDAKQSENVIGYAAYFRLINGFEKTLYMTVDQIKNHGGKYSKTFKHKSGLWNTDFEAMARKTVIKLLLQRYAPLSIEMQKATLADQGIVKDWENAEVDYEDNPTRDIEYEEVDPLIERVAIMIESATEVQHLEQIEQDLLDGVPDELQERFKEKLEQLKQQPPS